MKLLQFFFDGSGNIMKLAAKCKKQCWKIWQTWMLEWYKKIPVVEFSFKEQLSDQQCNCEVVYTALQTSGSEEK